MSTNDTPTRKPIPKRLRFEILRRDNHQCRYCGASAPDVRLTVDHVVPVVLGGSDDPANLVAACVDCNAGKSSSSPDQALVADVNADALRWAQAMRVAADLACEASVIGDNAVGFFDERWMRWSYRGGEPLPRPDDWADSVRAWIGYGLTSRDLDRASDIAMRKNRADQTWRYFCGVAWKMLTERQEAAADLIDKGLV